MDTSSAVRIVIIEHERGTDALRFGQWLRDAGATVHVVRPYQGDEVPSGQALASGAVADALVVLGGEAGALDDADNPWFPATRALLAESAAGKFPSFNICLGGQMLAAATSGTITRRSQGQYGALTVHATPEAAHDPVFCTVPQQFPAVLFHQDQITAPPTATLLITGTEAPVQAFRIGTMAWGTQFHPETTGDQVERWMAAVGESMTLPAGTSRRDVEEQIRRAEPAMEAALAPVAHAFVNVVRGLRAPTS